MILETGKPEIPGLYVVFVPGHGRHLDAHLVVWEKGAWRFRNANQPYPDEVIKWSGPLPGIDRITAKWTEYDL